MDTVNLTIDGKTLRVPAGSSILEAARSAGIYIPVLCHHPDLPPAAGVVPAAAIFQGGRRIDNAAPHAPGKGCGICVVAVAGTDDLVESCATPVEAGMVVTTCCERIDARRQENLRPILTRHRHACLTCAQQEGCSRTQCSSNVPENERCCAQFGHCELQNVANHVGIPGATPRWVPSGPAPITDHTLFERDDSLCIGCTRCVRACRDLRGVEAIGFVIDAAGQVQVGSLAETLETSGCKFCSACVAVCPTGALVDKNVSPATRDDELVPCRAACPAHIDVPGYLRLIARGKRTEAHAVIREKVPFAGILGRVCTHPCEAACRRGELDAAVSICALKRYAADGDTGLWKTGGRAGADSQKKVAVVGAGPAGLTAAFYLRRQGHAVTMFESNDKPGGMMRYGIPVYRLPREVLDREIEEILRLGIDFQPRRTLGKDLTLDGLKSDGYDAVFLAVGARQSKRIPLEGSDLPGVLRGLDFLKQVASGEAVRLKDRVVVIGGGNLAVDAAMSALRCGATDVTMACLESAAQMPAGPREIESARAEGVKLLPCRGPGRIIGEGGRVTGIELKECICVFDANGRFCPEFSGRKVCIRVDQVILAVGQAADFSFLGQSSAVSVKEDLIVVDGDTLETGMRGVYAGGDGAHAPGSIIDAIAAGRRAAAAIDRALGGRGKIGEVLFERGAPDPNIGRDEGFAGWKREAVPEIDPAERVKGFAEIVRGYADGQARREASRCLQCDLRLQLGRNPAPPVDRLAFDQAHVNRVPETEGVFQLLDGAHNVLSIKGSANLRAELLAALEKNEQALWFEFEEDKLFTRRESELIQRHLQAHGRMPGGGEDDLDDLF